MADRDRELPHDGPAGNIHLELLCSAGFDQAPPAMRAGIRQQNLVAFADLFGRGLWAICVGAVGMAAFASGCFGVGFGWSFAEESGLSFAGAKGLLETLV